METNVLYLVEANLCLVVFYCLYLFSIRKDTHFSTHRLYFILSVFFSLLIPYFATLLPIKVDQSIATIVLDAINVNGNSKTITGTSFFSSEYFLLSLYYSVSLLILIKFIYQVIVISKIRKNSQFEYTPNGNVYWTDQPTAFSFMNNMYIPKHLKHSETLPVIIEHEKVHTRQWHTIDIILIEVVSMFFWFNPIVWLYRKNVKETHEYLADGAVKEQYSNTSGYELLLFSHGIGFNMGLTNSFNQSLTLKRLIMLTKTPSSPVSKMKILLLLPLAGSLLLAFACSQNEEMPAKNAEQGKSVESEAKFDINTPPTSTEQTTDKQGEVFVVVDTPPEYKGGQPELIKYIQANLKYPTEAKENGIQGVVYVSFVISETGSVQNVKILRGVNHLLDAEAQRVIQGMPDWKPGKQNNQFVKVSMNLPINFKLQ